MHLRAGRAIRAVLEATSTRRAQRRGLRLARIHFQKGQPEDALRVLEGIHGRIPAAIRDDVEFLRANVYMALGRPAEAVDVLRELQGSDELNGFADYNLGIALLQEGTGDGGVEQLDRAGQVAAQRPRHPRDPRQVEPGARHAALRGRRATSRHSSSLDRVRLEGPFSNQALLRAGWADASAENFERAVVPWGILAERETTDAAVQEALLALPYAYSKLTCTAAPPSSTGGGGGLRQRAREASTLRSRASGRASS